MSAHEGSCLCGHIRYSVKTEPMRVTICHCRFCQRATGSAFLVEPIFGKSDFSLTAGEPTIYQHRSEGSGKIVNVHFCARCGTKLFLSFERFSEVVGVYGGTFDDPDWFERSAKNSRHIFLSVAQRGTVIPAGIDSYDQHITTNDGQPIKPTVFTEPREIR
jgi:hypothetical protein